MFHDICKNKKDFIIQLVVCIISLKDSLKLPAF